MTSTATPPPLASALCAGRNDNVVRYSLANTTAPLAVADYTYDSLPAHERDAVPTARQLTDLASRALTPPDNPTHRTTRAPELGPGCSDRCCAARGPGSPVGMRAAVFGSVHVAVGVSYCGGEAAIGVAGGCADRSRDAGGGQQVA